MPEARLKRAQTIPDETCRSPKASSDELCMPLRCARPNRKLRIWHSKKEFSQETYDRCICTTGSFIIKCSKNTHTLLSTEEAHPHGTAFGGSIFGAGKCSKSRATRQGLPRSLTPTFNCTHLRKDGAQGKRQ
jgi:hypothetical protein